MLFLYGRQVLEKRLKLNVYFKTSEAFFGRTNKTEWLYTYKREHNGPNNAAGCVNLHDCWRYTTTTIYFHFVS